MADFEEKGQVMLNWEQTDKLNEIATNDALSASERMSRIQDFWRNWASMVNEDASALDYTPNWRDSRIPREPVIDPSTEAVRANTPLTGNSGFYAYAGYMDR